MIYSMWLTVLFTGTRMYGRMYEGKDEDIYIEINLVFIRPVPRVVFSRFLLSSYGSALILSCGVLSSGIFQRVSQKESYVKSLRQDLRTEIFWHGDDDAARRSHRHLAHTSHIRGETPRIIL